jgi:hypothetical protein
VNLRHHTARNDDSGITNMDTQFPMDSNGRWPKEVSFLKKRHPLFAPSRHSAYQTHSAKQRHTGRMLP